MKLWTIPKKSIGDLWSRTTTDLQNSDQQHLFDQSKIGMSLDKYSLSLFLSLSRASQCVPTKGQEDHPSVSRSVRCWNHLQCFF
jgi:hypothetical protein